ncbi:hypothetical protein CTAYLR_009995 [Chrysophaeum taylorii]|uniref:Tetrapyrrole methylase domain-containing protein n=1 Tax=Chrysophaeum taylorii TaxID=2483200 RepID=A0AAD7UA30_9STRA|nr:hypothetical protein CTAYLR_009995 [Chrysophaeum taylorii]
MRVALMFVASCRGVSWGPLAERAIAKVEADIAGGARLLVVPTPLGEATDVSFRGIAALERCDVVACEDTRKAGALLAAVGVERKGKELERHDAATARASAARLVARMREGKVVALTSDAGTPGVSDPGSTLVRETSAAGLKVVALPGPCAATVAFSATGFDAARGFCFLGFAPRKTSKLESVLAEAALRPVVLYESPKRVAATVGALADLDAEREVVVARELTKTHQEVYRGTLGEARDWLSSAGRARGEFTIVLDAGVAAAAGAAVDEEGDLLPLAARLLGARRAAGQPLAVAAKAVAVDLDLPKSVVYGLAAAAPRRRPPTT